jgi:hypothetical protein
MLDNETEPSTVFYIYPRRFARMPRRERKSEPRFATLHFTAVKKPRQDHTLARSGRASVKRTSSSARQPNVLGV